MSVCVCVFSLYDYYVILILFRLNHKTGVCEGLCAFPIGIYHSAKIFNCINCALAYACICVRVCEMWRHLISIKYYVLFALISLLSNAQKPHSHENWDREDEKKGESTPRKNHHIHIKHSVMHGWGNPFLHSTCHCYMSASNPQFT